MNITTSPPSEKLDARYPDHQTRATSPSVCKENKRNRNTSTADYDAIRNTQSTLNIKFTTLVKNSG